MPLKNLIKNLAVPSFEVPLPPGGPNTTCYQWVSERDLGPSRSFPASLCTAHLSGHFWLSLSGKSDLTLLCSSKTASINFIDTVVYSKAWVPLDQFVHNTLLSHCTWRCLPLTLKSGAHTVPPKTAPAWTFLGAALASHSRTRFSISLGIQPWYTSNYSTIFPVVYSILCIFNF